VRDNHNQNEKLVTFIGFILYLYIFSMLILQIFLEPLKLIKVTHHIN